MNINNAIKDVSDVYKNLKEIVDGVVKKHSNGIDMIFAEIKKYSDKLELLPNKEIIGWMLRLQIAEYEFSAKKDDAQLMQECSAILTKVTQASIYALSDGTQSARSNKALIDTQDKQLVTAVYNAVSSNMKTKLDECHRMMNLLNSVLISNNAEARRKNARIDDDLYGNNISEDSEV